MFIAFAAALLFTFTYGYVAAKSVRARKVMLPLLDILQSVPVLGFLSITVTGFLALFPGSLLGVECASIFAIFTAQAWNMTFGFYHSLITIPAELQEAASVYRHEPLAALHEGRIALVRDRPDVELDDELRRRLVLRRAERSDLRPEQEHQAAGPRVVHGGGGRGGGHARRRLRDRGDDRHHRGHRSARLATAGGVGREVQAGANGGQGQSDVVDAGSVAALVRAGVVLRSRRTCSRQRLPARVGAHIGPDGNDLGSDAGSGQDVAPDCGLGPRRAGVSDGSSSTRSTSSRKSGPT